MFSFFKKKTPEVSPSDEVPIPGYESQPTAPNNNDFVIVENKNQDPSQPYVPPRNNYMYPPLPNQQYYNPNIPTANNVPQAQIIVNNIDGVPFNLSPAISSENTFEMQQSNVDHILATITRSISIEDGKDYDFSLERTILGI